MHISAKHIEGVFAAVLLTALGFVLVDFLITPITFKQYFFIELIIIGLDRLIGYIKKSLKI
jgi:hypothetical protein